MQEAKLSDLVDLIQTHTTPGTAFFARAEYVRRYIELTVCVAELVRDSPSWVAAVWSRKDSVPIPLVDRVAPSVFQASLAPGGFDPGPGQLLSHSPRC
jgi:hypothetical protein